MIAWASSICRDALERANFGLLISTPSTQRIRKEGAKSMRIIPDLKLNWDKTIGENNFDKLLYEHSPAGREQTYC